MSVDCQVFPEVVSLFREELTEKLFKSDFLIYLDHRFHTLPPRSAISSTRSSHHPLWHFRTEAREEPYQGHMVVRPRHPFGREHSSHETPQLMS